MAPSEQTPQGGRRKVVFGVLAGALLVSGAIVAGVLGTRTQSKDRVAPQAVAIKPLAEPSEYQQILAALTNPVVPVAVVTPVASSPSGGAATTTTPTTPPNVTFSDGSTAESEGKTFSQAISGLFFGSKDTTTNAGGAVLDVDHLLQPIPDSALQTTAAWKQLGARTAAICTPKDGVELVSMASNSGCTIIILTRGRGEVYNIRQTINITDTKIIIGNPISRPTLNATNKIQRLFDVRPGGRLDLRAVTTFRGFGWATEDGLRVITGGDVRVLLGGSFTATGVVFSEPRQTLEHFLEGAVPGMLYRRNLNFGGHVLVLGGTTYLQGCLFLRFRPYGSEVIHNLQIGRDLLMVAGNVYYVGTAGVNVNLFANNAVAGNFMSILGGVGVVVGMGLVNVAGAQCQWGAGIQVFGGGGVVVTVGWGYVSVNGVLARGAFGQFSVGGGLLLQTGYTQSRAWGVGAVFNAGQTFSVGGGIQQHIGGAVASTAGCYIFAGVGGTAFVGSGQMRWIGMPQFRTAGTQASYGVGQGFYNGAGIISLIYCPQFITQFIRLQVGLGTDHFLGAGINININNTRFTFQYGNAFFGEGNQGWVGAGGAVYIRNPNLSARRLSYSTTKNTYTVAGTAVRRGPSQGEIWVTKAGITNLYIPGVAWLNLKQQNASQAFWAKVHTAIDPAVSNYRQSADARDAAKWDAVRNKVGSRIRQLHHGHGRKRLLNELTLTELAHEAGAGYSVDIPRSKLLAIDNSAVEIVTGKGGLPDSRLFAAPEFKNYVGGFAKLLADGLVPLGDGFKSQDARINYGKIWTNNTDCFVCNLPPFPTADHVSGPGGQGQCETSDLCGGSTVAESLASAELAAKTTDLNDFPGLSLVPLDLDGPDQKLALPSTQVHVYELTLYCESTDPTVQTASLRGAACISDDYLKSLLRAYTLPGYEADYALTATPQQIHKAVQHLDEDGGLQASLAIPKLEGAGACEGFTKYAVYLTTQEEAVNALLTQEWAALEKDATELTATLAENVGPAAKLRPCHVTVTATSKATVPSSDNMPDYKPSVNNIIGPAISVGKAGSIVPVSDTEAGETLKLYIQNFPKGAPILVQLSNGGIGKVGGPVVASLASFDDDGFAELEWTPPADLAPGKYFLMAFQENFPALFANSQAFDIDAPYDGSSE